MKRVGNSRLILCFLILTASAGCSLDEPHDLDQKCFDEQHQLSQVFYELENSNPTQTYVCSNKTTDNHNCDPVQINLEKGYCPHKYSCIKNNSNQTSMYSCVKNVDSFYNEDEHTICNSNDHFVRFNSDNTEPEFELDVLRCTEITQFDNEQNNSVIGYCCKNDAKHCGSEETICLTAEQSDSHAEYECIQGKCTIVSCGENYNPIIDESGVIISCNEEKCKTNQHIDKISCNNINALDCYKCVDNDINDCGADHTDCEKYKVELANANKYSSKNALQFTCNKEEGRCEILCEEEYQAHNADDTDDSFYCKATCGSISCNVNEECKITYEKCNIYSVLSGICKGDTLNDCFYTLTTFRRTEISEEEYNNLSTDFKNDQLSFSRCLEQDSTDCTKYKYCATLNDDSTACITYSTIEKECVMDDSSNNNCASYRYFNNIKGEVQSIEEDKFYELVNTNESSYTQIPFYTHESLTRQGYSVNNYTYCEIFDESTSVLTCECSDGYQKTENNNICNPVCDKDGLIEVYIDLNIQKAKCIRTIDELMEIPLFLESERGKAIHAFYLNNDINLGNQSDWDPIGFIKETNAPFTGTFLGNNHTISGNLTCHGNKCGLFGELSNAIFHNLYINLNVDNQCKTNSITTNCIETGILASRASNSFLYNISAMGTINSKNVDAGGLLGSSQNDSLTNCTFYGNIESNQNVGGLIGHLQSTSFTPKRPPDTYVLYQTSLNQCHVAATLRGKLVGGLVATVPIHSSVNIDHSSFSGEIVGQMVGGLLGSTQNQVSIVNSSVTNSILSATSTIGGLVGEGLTVRIDHSFVSNTNVIGFTAGGLLGELNYFPETRDNMSATVLSSYFDGTINSVGLGLAGGIIGSAINGYEKTEMIRIVNIKDSAVFGRIYGGTIGGYFAKTTSANIESSLITADLIGDEEISLIGGIYLKDDFFLNNNDFYTDSYPGTNHPPVNTEAVYFTGSVYPMWNFDPLEDYFCGQNRFSLDAHLFHISLTNAYNLCEFFELLCSDSSSNPNEYNICTCNDNPNTPPLNVCSYYQGDNSNYYLFSDNISSYVTPSSSGFRGIIYDLILPFQYEKTNNISIPFITRDENPSLFSDFSSYTWENLLCTISTGPSSTGPGEGIPTNYLLPIPKSLPPIPFCEPYTP